MDRSSYKEHKFQHRRKAYKFSWACWGCRRSTAPPIIDILCLMHLQPHLAVEDVQPVIGNFRDTLVNLVQRRSLCEGVEDGRLEDFDQLQLTPPLHFKPSKSSGRTVMDSQGLGLHKKCDRVLWGGRWIKASMVEHLGLRVNGAWRNLLLARAQRWTPAKHVVCFNN